MPFTFSHPAIVMPLKKSSYFSLTALVIGSLMPDFEYFIRMQIIGKHGHTLAGIFYFDLPLGLSGTFIFHCLIRDSLLDNLPVYFKARFYCLKLFNWVQYWKEHKVIVLYSLLLGIFSHLFWDAFTHYNGYFVTKIPVLQNNIFQIPVFKYLQHLSTLVGALVILLIIRKLPVDKSIKDKPNKRYWIVWILTVLTVTFFRFFFDLEELTIGNLLVTLIMAGILGLLISGYIYKKYFRKVEN